MVPGALSKRIHGVVGLMLIYGNTPGDIKRMMLKKKYKLLTVAVLIILALMLLGCSTAKQNSMGEFFKALGSGDISVIKEKFKGAEHKEDGSWDSIDKVE